MRILVTGAGGFLGRHVVGCALRRGHEVRALVRPAYRGAFFAEGGHPRLELVRGDLRAPEGIPSHLRAVDCVVHLAAAKSGDLHDQFGSTVAATENLLAAMDRAAVRRMVLTSSFAVYEYLGRRSWGVLDESSPTAVQPGRRDAYCQTKLLQERLVLRTAEAGKVRAVVLRPGVVFGRGNLWSARLGAQVSDRLWLCFGALAPLPLTFVANCAEAVVLAAEHEHREPAVVLNVVDDDPPTKLAYLLELRARVRRRKPIPLIIPWPVLRAVARFSAWMNAILFHGDGKLPGVLVPASIHARCRPLRCPNTRIREVLGWRPRVPWRRALDLSMETGERAEAAGQFGNRVANPDPVPWRVCQ